MTDVPATGSIRPVDVALVRGLLRLSAIPPSRQCAVVTALAFTTLLVDRIVGRGSNMVLGFSLTVALAAWLWSRTIALVIGVAMIATSTASTAWDGNMVSMSSAGWMHAGTRLLSLALTAMIIGALRSYVGHTVVEARLDPLTGVLTRRAVMTELRRMLASSDRYPVSVVFFDLDDLKQINDAIGHAGGDTHLRRFAERLTRASRDTDAVGRIGGDEFLIVCPGTSAEQAAMLAARLVAKPGAPSASWGVADNRRTWDADALVALADAEMYRSKQTRGIVTPASPPPGSVVRPAS